VGLENPEFPEIPGSLGNPEFPGNLEFP